MNTRLQVEHPVTEEITGIDLVEWQIRVASGEALPMTQKRSLRVATKPLSRCASMRRSCCWQVLPSPGPIESLKTPSGFGVRFDTGYESGDEISQYYDNLVGKLHRVG